MKKINSVEVLFLTLITLGIYGVVHIRKLASECEQTGIIKVKIPKSLNVLLYILNVVSLASLIICYVTVEPDIFISAFTAAFVFFRVVDGITIGMALNDEIGQIRDYFGFPAKSHTVAWVITGIFVPFVTVALAQRQFNEAEDKAAEIESVKGSKS